MDVCFFDSWMPKSIKWVAKLIPDLDYLHPSHGQTIANPNILASVAQALEEVNIGGMTYSQENLYGETRQVYQFYGFFIFA